MEATSKQLGMAILVNRAEELLGVLTDGDIRRALMSQPNVNQIDLLSVITVAPKTISPQELAEKALRLMELHKITALVVTQANIPVGVLHLHHILQAGIR
jgi:arabinose-5-phosphate isomerase